MLNQSVALACIVLSLFGILQSAFGTRVDKNSGRHFIFFFSVLLIFASADLATLLIQGKPGRELRIVLSMTSYFEYCSPSLLAYIVSHYLLSIVDAKHELKKLRVTMIVMVFVHNLFITVSQYTGMIYQVNSLNVVNIGKLYSLAYVMNAAMLIIDFVLLVRRRGMLSKSEKIVFGIFMTVPSVAIILRIFAVKDGVIIVGAMALTAFVMYVFTLSDQTERYNRQQQQNSKLKIDIMLSQIQPHFLYNSLLVIRQICLSDPTKAASAIDDFAKYLRHNMDSITENAPIPFETELKHVRQYVQLQQLRFEDDLDVRYDIECSDFRIPTLTLQPLVENAIRYGVRKSEDGRGTVTVRTREYDDRYEVSVIDDGPGFVPESVPQDKENASLGLRNVRERLEMTCGGELVIDSVIGEGTNATIVLPRNEEE
ncbi:MAG: histidine kinase [Clostridia bacterium]|nr:histidine kinase [Clostridia bacterium]